MLSFWTCSRCCLGGLGAGSGLGHLLSVRFHLLCWQVLFFNANQDCAWEQRRISIWFLQDLTWTSPLQNTDAGARADKHTHIHCVEFVGRMLERKPDYRPALVWTVSCTQIENITLTSVYYPSAMSRHSFILRLWSSSYCLFVLWHNLYKTTLEHKTNGCCLQQHSTKCDNLLSPCRMSGWFSAACALPQKCHGYRMYHRSNLTEVHQKYIGHVTPGEARHISVLLL